MRIANNKYHDTYIRLTYASSTLSRPRQKEHKNHNFTNNTHIHETCSGSIKASLPVNYSSEHTSA